MQEQQLKHLYMCLQSPLHLHMGQLSSGAGLLTQYVPNQPLQLSYDTMNVEEVVMVH